MKAIDLRLIVALGATAAQSLAGRAIPAQTNCDTILNVANGLPSMWQTGWVFVTIHPSALLRLQDEEEKRSGHASFVNDLRSIERLLQFLGDGEGPTFAPPSSVVPRSALNP